MAVPWCRSINMLNSTKMDKYKKYTRCEVRHQLINRLNL